MGKVIPIIINGSGGVGKDHLILKFAGSTTQYFVRNYSSIDPVKTLAYAAGWDGIKDDRSRKFLSDLKSLLVKYNDFPTVYLKSKLNDVYMEFNDSESNVIVFLHIREPDEINKFIAQYRIYDNIKIKTLLVVSKTEQTHGNKSDDNVKDWNYDVVFRNDGNTESVIRFNSLIKKIAEEYINENN